MKKICLIFVILLLTVSAASAQMIRLGAKAGLSMLATDVRSGEASDGNLYDEFKSKDIGWHAGLMARIKLPLTNLHVQPELLYTHATYQLLEADGSSEKLTSGNIELPVLLGFKVLFLNAHVGPTFTLANMTGGEVYTIETPDVGFQAGVGLTLKRVTLDLRYQGYFAKKWKDLDLGDVTRQLKANDGYFNLSVGYFF